MKITKIAFIGDSYAVNPIELSQLWISENIATEGIRGVPIWDIEIKKMLEKYCSEYSHVFLSPCQEINGIRRIGCLVKIFSLPVQERCIFFDSFEERWGCKWNQKEVISQAERELLLTKYLEQLDYYISIYPNIIIVPLAVKFQAHLIPLKNKYPLTYDVLVKRYKSVNLDTLNKGEQTIFRDWLYHLSVSGTAKLINLIKQYCEEIK